VKTVAVSRTMNIPIRAQTYILIGTPFTCSVTLVAEAAILATLAEEISVC
jgi:hypothetical protein